MSAEWSPFRFKDRDWKELSEDVGLPKAARAELENIVGMSKYIARLDSDSRPPHETKKRLAEIRRKSADLLSDLSQIRAHEPDVFMALVSPDAENDLRSWPTGAPPRALRAVLFDNHVRAFESLVEHLQYAEAHLPKGERGDKTAAAHVLTREIDELLQRHTSYKLSVGDRHPDPAKELLSRCLELLKMDLSANSMVKWLVAKRRRQSSSAEQSGTLP